MIQEFRILVYTHTFKNIFIPLYVFSSSPLVLSTTGLCPLWSYFPTYGNFLKTVTQNIHRFPALNLLREIAKARGKNSSYSVLVIKLKHKRRKSLWNGKQILKCFHWVHSYSRVVSLWVFNTSESKRKVF